MEPKVTPEQVKAALSNLACHYPSSGHNQVTIASIAPDFHDLLGHLTSMQFAQVVKLHLKSSAFFPTVRDLLTCVSTLEPHWQKERQARTALPEQTLTDEDVERNKRQCVELLRRFRAKNGMHETGGFERKPYPVDANAWEEQRKRWNDWCGENAAPEAKV